MIATIEDTTEKKQLENEIMRISETERQKVGQDLHDDLGPHLIGIEVLSKLLLKKIGEKSLPEKAMVKKIRNLINDAITKTRNLARGLCPVYLMDHGLEYSLQEMVQNVEEVFGISCQLKYGEIQLPGDIGICTHLYYIIQETVHNAVKHGSAENILIEIFKDDDKIIIKIKDDGTGLVDKTTPAGMGLRIMEYRAKMIGAAIDMNSTKGEGTKVKISFQDNSELKEAENRYVTE